MKTFARETTNSRFQELFKRLMYFFSYHATIRNLWIHVKRIVIFKILALDFNVSRMISVLNLPRNILPTS